VRGVRSAVPWRLVWLVTCCAVFASAAAQGPTPSASAEPVTVEGFVERAPASVMLSLHGGLPAYRSVTLGATLKAEQFGVALRGGWGTVGASFGAQVRWYPPLPGALPLYVAVGADAYDGSVTPHGVVGVHVPLGQALRFDLEGGVASATLGGERVVTPHLSVGIAYAFSVDVAPSGSGTSSPTTAPTAAGASARCEPEPPNAASLDAAVDASVRAFVRDGVALYGNAYRDLRYRYTIVERRLNAERAEVVVRYSGSARAILGGQLVEAAGDAVASYTWTGCGWRLRELNY